jgi:putative thioredoxin
MIPSDLIVDVNETDFEYEVLSYSQNVPVVVEFWATWCQPCKVLGPMLESMTQEAGGAFRLARVDVDQNPNLALHYTVRSIPAVKVFSSAQVAGEFTGVIPEEKVREFLSKITPPSPQQLLQEKADSMFFLHQWGQAEKTYRELLEQNAASPESLLGLAKTLLMENKNNEALAILQDFPLCRLFSTSELIKPYAEDVVAQNKGELPVDTELGMAYANAIRLASRGNLPAALDGLLDVLRQDKTFRHGRARQVIIALLELMGEEDPQTREYRSELASVLF